MIANRVWLVAALTAGVILAGCSGSQQNLLPSAGASSSSSTVVPASHAGSWMGRSLKKRDLLYVSNANGTVNVYRYWQRKLVGVLTAFQDPVGVCADFAGHVYIVDDQAGKVIEYAHGGAKPIRVLRDTAPYGCSVSPSNGDLAIASVGTGYDGLDDRYTGGKITVYPHGSGSRITYRFSKSDHFVSCAYDDHGNLLAASQQGYSGFYYVDFYYLAKNSARLTPIDLPGPTSSWEWETVTQLAWDGEYWVVDSFYLYRYTINVKKAQYVNRIALLEKNNLGQVWIYRKSPQSQGTQVVGVGTGNVPVVNYWPYPAGGNALHTITKDISSPSGIAVSLGTR
jgi:hypothetical protein